MASILEVYQQKQQEIQVILDATRRYIDHYLETIPAGPEMEFTYVYEDESRVVFQAGDDQTTHVSYYDKDNTFIEDAVIPVTFSFLSMHHEGLYPFFTSSDFFKAYEKYLYRIVLSRQDSHPVKKGSYEEFLLTLIVERRPPRFKEGKVEIPKEFSSDYLDTVKSLYQEEKRLILQPLLMTPYKLTMEILEAKRIKLNQIQYIQTIVYYYYLSIVKNHPSVYVNFREIFHPRDTLVDALDLGDKTYTGKAKLPMLRSLVHKAVADDVKFVSLGFLQYIMELEKLEIEQDKLVVEGIGHIGFTFNGKPEIDPEMSFLSVVISTPEREEQLSINQLDLFSYGYSTFDHFLPDWEDLSVREALWEAFQSFLVKGPLINIPSSPVYPLWSGPYLGYIWVMYQLYLGRKPVLLDL